MTESARACVEFALRRMGVHRIRCAAATDNYPSLRVISRVGFRFEGIARQAEFVGSRWLDHAVFARLATDEIGRDSPCRAPRNAWSMTGLTERLHDLPARMTFSIRNIGSEVYE